MLSLKHCIVAYTVVSGVVVFSLSVQAEEKRGACTCRMEPSGVLRIDAVTMNDCSNKNQDMYFDVEGSTAVLSGCSFEPYVRTTG